MAAEDLLERQRYFADRRLGARRVDGERRADCRCRRRRCASSAASASCDAPADRARALSRSSLSICAARTAALSTLRISIGCPRLGPVLVDADRPSARPESMRACVRGGGLLDAQLGHARLDRLGHAAELLDLLRCGPRRCVGEIVRSAARRRTSRPRDRSMRVVPLSCCRNELRVARDAGGEIASAAPAPRRAHWCAAIGCGLASPPSPRSQVRMTLLKTSCAASDQPEVWQWVRSASERSSFGSNGLHQLRPQQARRAQLRHLHEEVHADAQEERQPRREAVDVEAGGEPGAHIFDAVGERVGELEIGGRARLLHVIAGDRDRIEFRHVRARCRRRCRRRCAARASADRCRCCAP